MSVIVETVELYKTYKLGKIDVEVLKGINIQVNSGEFISIMGPSGSGKSTLLYLLGALDKPTSGHVKIKDKIISKFSDSSESKMRRRDIGFVFQFYNLIPNLNVEENVLLPVLLDGKKAKTYKEKVSSILDELGILEKKMFTPRELSGGQQQRVAIARALITEPDIILADEPTGNLDTVSGKEVLKILKKISEKKRKTIIMVTHAIESLKYSTKTINLRDGKVFVT